MKKTIFTLSLVALFSIAANAQDSKHHPKKTAKEEKSESVPSATVSEKTEHAPVKKGGTRMAINEKGTSGNEAPKHKPEEKKTETPNAQPASHPKQD